MADFNKVKQDIKDDIRPNGVGEITGQTMQNTLVEIVELEEQAYNELNSEIETSKREASQEIAKTNTRLATAEKNISDNKAEASQEIAKTNTRLATAEKNISDNKAEANQKFAKVNEALENKAQVDERYPKLTAGFADNLIGRGEATAEEFTYRASAGMGRSITDDTARVKKIKGNSVVWNQRSTMPKITTNKKADYFEIFRLPIKVKNHRYFIAFTDPNLCGHSIRLIGLNEAEEYVEYTIPYTSHAEAIFNMSPHKGNIYVRSLANDGVAEGQFDHLLFVDLTKAFPNDWQNINTVDDFYARIPSGIDIYAYNEGEIINLNTEAIKTVGFNQWDEQWERGYIISTTGALADSDNVIRTKNFIQVIPNAEYYYQVPDYASPGNCHFYGYDADFAFVQTIWSTGGRVTKIPQNIKYIKATAGTSTLPVTTYNHDICINLSHTGTENGKYKPYTPFTRELPIIKKCFPEGMRKVGTAFDSIEWDSTKQKWVAVQRVGERAYASGDESDATVLTNNTTTLYELAEHIVTEIEEENINFDYYVEDFGTEEALSSVPSAPFRADVVYTFNAVDTIRNNYLEIEELKKQMVQMQNAVSAMQTAQVTNEEV